jgi:hypothetical protein
MSDLMQAVILIANMAAFLGMLIIYIGIKLQMKISDAMYKELVAIKAEMKARKTSSITMKVEPSEELKDLINSVKSE